MKRHLIFGAFISVIGAAMMAVEPVEAPKTSAEVTVGTPEIFGNSKAGWGPMKKEIPAGNSFYGLRLLPPDGAQNKNPFPAVNWIKPDSLEWTPATETKGDSFYNTLAFSNDTKAAGWPTLAFALTKAASELRTVSFTTTDSAPTQQITIKLVSSLSEYTNAEGNMDPNTSGDILTKVTIGDTAVALNKVCIALTGYGTGEKNENFVKYSIVPITLPLKPSTKYTFTIQAAPFAQAYARHTINGFFIPTTLSGGTVAAEVKPGVKYEKTETVCDRGRANLSTTDPTDKDASTGKSLRMTPEKGMSGAVSDSYPYPPYPGLYRFTFRMKIDNNTGDAEVVRLSATFPGVKNQELSVKPKDFKAANTYQDFTVEGIVPENSFGCYMVIFNAEAKRTVWWDYGKYELMDYYDDQLAAEEFYAGFKMADNVTRQAGDEKLRTHITYSANLESNKIREALTVLGKKAPEAVSLPADMRQYQPSGPRKAGEWRETAYIDHGQVKDRVRGFPQTPDDFKNLDLIILANVPLRGLGAPVRLLLHDWVKKAGGGVLITGGSMGLGKGYAEGTSLLPMLPVEFIGVNDTRPAKDGSLVFKDPALKSIVGDEKISTRFYQEVKVKPGANVLVTTADGAPLLVSWQYGKGQVAVWTGLPLGKAPEGQTEWWMSPKWPDLMAKVIGDTTGK